MKKLLMVLLFASVTMVTFGQEVDFIPDTLFTKKVTDIEYAKKYRNNEKFSAIMVEDGSVIKVGDVMTLGKPSGINTSRQVNTGLVGGSITTTNNFQYILLGRLGASVLNGEQYLPQSLQNSSVVIKEIKASHTSIFGSRNSPLTYWIILDINGRNATILNVTAAISNGEFVNHNAALTKDGAILKLKEKKELFDLGVITKEDFEKVKSELMPILTKN